MLDQALREQIAQAAGLAPRTVLLLGTGVGREDAKALLSNRCVGYAVQSLPQFAMNALAHVAPSDWANNGGTFLSRLGRREILRKLWSNSAIRAQLSSLERLSERSGFWSRLDGAIEAARRTDVDEAEWEVWEEVLAQKHLSSPRRRESRLAIRGLARAVDGVMASLHAADETGALRLALQQGALSEYVRHLRDRLGVESIVWISPMREEAVTEAGIAAISEGVPVLRWDGRRADSSHVSKVQVHSSRDGRDATQDLARRIESGGVCILPDDPVAANRLVEAMLPLRKHAEESRDPGMYRGKPGLAVLLRAWQSLDVTTPITRSRLECVLHAVGWENQVKPLREDGFVAGATPPRLHGSLLARLEIGDWPGLQSPISLAEFTKKNRRVADLLGLDGRSLQLLEELRTRWEREFTILGLKDARFSLPEWIERLRERIRDSVPGPEKLKAIGGLRLYRGSRLPPVQWAIDETPLRQVWAYILSDEGLLFPLGAWGDECWSSGERDGLSREFAVRSRWDAWKEAQANLRAWGSSTDVLKMVEARFEQHSRGIREKDASRWTAIWPEAEWTFLKAPSSQSKSGSAPRADYAFQMPAGWSEKSRFSASLLEAWSRCPALALETRVLKWEDPMLPTLEPWPASKGAWMHRVLESVLTFPLEVSDEEFLDRVRRAMDQAEFEVRPKGWFQNEASRNWVRGRLVRRLQQFWKEEISYRARARTEPHALEWEFEWATGEGVSLIGRIDRIDRHRDGWVVMDYKTGSDLPNGIDLVEQGYRTQLGIYALAVQSQLKRPVLAVQWIPLSARGGRGKGVFSKPWAATTVKQIQPDQNPVVVTRSALQVMDLEPEAIWKQVEAHVLRQVRALRGGQAPPEPRLGIKECDRCLSQDFCGLSRRKVESGRRE